MSRRGEKISPNLAIQGGLSQRLEATQPPIQADTQYQLSSFDTPPSSVGSKLEADLFAGVFIRN